MQEGRCGWLGLRQRWLAAHRRAASSAERDGQGWEAGPVAHPYSRAQHSTAQHGSWGVGCHGASLHLEAAFWLTASVQARQVVPNVFVGLAGALREWRARRARRRRWRRRRVGRWRGPAQMPHSERRVEDCAAAGWGACAAAHRPPARRCVRAASKNTSCSVQHHKWVTAQHLQRVHAAAQHAVSAGMPAPALALTGVAVSGAAWAVKGAAQCRHSHTAAGCAPLGVPPHHQSCRLRGRAGRTSRRRAAGGAAAPAVPGQSRLRRPSPQVPPGRTRLAFHPARQLQAKHKWEGGL